MLQSLYNGSLAIPTAAQRVAAVQAHPAHPTTDSYKPVLRGGTGTLYEFDQGVFIGGGSWSDTFGLAQSAFVYIPDACLANATTTRKAPRAEGGCILHAAFHGCLQTQDDIGKQFMTGGGYLPWADANNFVVLFPQAISNLLNPKGCFDWCGADAWRCLARSYPRCICLPAHALAGGATPARPMRPTGGHRP